MNPRDARHYLDSFINYEVNLKKADRNTFKLERIHRLLINLGSPQNQFKSIHVAGTKGKGSTCALTASILEQAAFKVGLYTSPHLYDYKERIRILNEPQKFHPLKDIFKGIISDDDLASAVEEIKPGVEKTRREDPKARLTFFEVFTALAFFYFARQNVDFAVLETGLGGRLDATNAVHSLIAAIAPLSIEHTQQLGPTLNLIAAEKAAIIKDQNQIAVIAPQKKAAKDVIRKQCELMNAKTFWVGKDVRYRSLPGNIHEQVFEITTQEKKYPNLKMNLAGEHQVINAAVSVGIVEALNGSQYNISESAVRNGLARTIWPGRFEIVKAKPLVILDGAHNPESVKALVQTLQKILPKKTISFILGISEDKDKEGIARALSKIAKRIVFTQANHPRALKLSQTQLRKLFPQKEIILASNIKDALPKILKKISKDEVIVVTGSIFIVGEARKLCIK